MTLPSYPDPTGAPDPSQPFASPIQPGAPLPPPGDPAQLGYPQPMGYPGQPAWGPPGYPAYVYAPARPTNGMAIASMVVSIASLPVCYGLTGIVGALLGHAARRQIRERGEAGDGMALAGIIIGWIGFGIAIIAILFFAFVIFGSSASYEESSDF